jgi:Uma2 family endonuclease
MSTHELSSGFDFAAPPAPVLHRFTVEQYHRMIESGVLTENDKVQLIEGIILKMTPVGTPHAYAVDALQEEIHKRLPAGWKVFVQRPVTLATSEPEPDLSIVVGSRTDYKARHPGPAEIAILIEVADSSLALDRGPKAVIYAAARIPEYWIVNLHDRQIEIYRQPQGEGPAAAYHQLTTLAKSETVSLILSGKLCGEFPVAAVLP